MQIIGRALDVKNFTTFIYQQIVTRINESIMFKIIFILMTEFRYSFWLNLDFFESLPMPKQNHWSIDGGATATASYILPAKDFTHLTWGKQNSENWN